MGPILAVLWLLSMATHGFSSAIQIGALQGVVHQCDILTIGWTGGESPTTNAFDCESRSELSTRFIDIQRLRLRTTSVEATTDAGPTTIAIDVTGFSFEWVVDYPAAQRFSMISGSVVLIGVGDNFEDVDVMDPFTVLASTDSSCLGRSTTVISSAIASSASSPTSSPFESTSSAAVQSSAPAAQSSAPAVLFSSRRSDIGAIAGGVGGGVGGVLLLILGFWCCRRNKGADKAAAAPGALENAGSMSVSVRSSSTKGPASQIGYLYRDDTNQKMSQPAAVTTPPSQFQPQAMVVPSTHRHEEVQSIIMGLGYQQTAASPTMMAANPTSPIQRRQEYDPYAGEQGQTRVTTTPDSRTIMSWEPTRSPKASSAVYPLGILIRGTLYFFRFEEIAKNTVVIDEQLTKRISGRLRDGQSFGGLGKSTTKVPSRRDRLMEAEREKILITWNWRRKKPGTHRKLPIFDVAKVNINRGKSWENAGHFNLGFDASVKANETWNSLPKFG
ncbi:hypothetical protein C8R45DRAFT_923845 [Mycena sanguinolenta]|nr:hypothetical protein C8R45DRAFT_923845 [Mycena sanguinolenta]